MRWEDYIVKTQVQDYLGKIDEVSALVVMEVYPGSVAAQAGIKVGFYYLPSAQQKGKDIMALRFIQGEQDFLFYDLTEKKQHIITAKGYLFGMALRKTVLGLCVDLENSNKVDYEAAASVVHEGLDDDFLKIAVAASQSEAVRQSHKDEITGGLVALLQSSQKPDLELAASNDNQDDMVVMAIPEHFFMAAYLAFKGKADEARRLLPKQHDYSAIYGFGGGMAALYFLAQGYIAQKDYLHRGHNGEMEGIAATAPDPFDAVFMLRRAIELNPDSKRALALHETLSEERPVFPDYAPEPFEGAYILPAHDPQKLRPTEVSAPVSFAKQVAQLQEGQFLLVVLLGLYRANGFYSQAMTLLGQLYPFISQHFVAVHIITAYDESMPLKSHWLDGETFAFEQGVPLSILYDEDNEVCEEMEVNASPHGLIIDHKGMVIHRGALDSEAGYWQAIEVAQPVTVKHSAAILSFPFDNK